LAEWWWASPASAFSHLGIAFNYLVSLFYKQPVRQGLFGKPIFKTPLDQHFGWLGLVTLFGGLGVGITSLILGINGWEIARLWLYLLGSAMFILVGRPATCLLDIAARVDELSQRGSAACQFRHTPRA
jgi:hypothetical protein